jgi:hypothetical protein
MSEPSDHISIYQQRANTFMSKAEAASDPVVTRRYMDLAEMYLQLVEMEIRRLEIRGEGRTDGGK